MSSKTQVLLDKYGEIIAEEVNVKSVSVLDDTVVVTVTYIPLGQKLGGQFGKDTARIIAAAKNGNAEQQSDGTLVVYDGQDQRFLAPDMYEIRRSGLEEDHQTVEGGVIVSLDFTVTEELKKEGVAREISRFLNQMRKDAGLLIDQKIACYYHTQDNYMQEVIQDFQTMLVQEALLNELVYTDGTGKVTTMFTSDEGSVTFYFE